jgi:twitching motility protein PilT
MKRIHELMRYARNHGASDLHLTAGLEPRMRRHGKLRAVRDWPKLCEEDVRAFMRAVAPPAKWQSFRECGDVDFTTEVKSVGRFRANYFAHESGSGAVFRYILDEVVPFDRLRLPKSVATLGRAPSGLVLVTGPSGAGKTTTLAALVDIINTNVARHILTIEDPVEYVHRNKKSVISHREIGTDVEGFAPALRAATRQDANVVMVGELRDPESMAMALAAAELGVLVLATMNTNSAARTIDQVIATFPAEEHALVRTILAQTLVGVVSQLLVPAADGSGRYPVAEVLLWTPALAATIREGNTQMIDSIIQAGSADGMQLMDDALAQAAARGRIDPKRALSLATDKERFGRLRPERKPSRRRKSKKSKRA